jgi:SAM-dependent MidA family methyltransferase
MFLAGDVPTRIPIPGTRVEVNLEASVVMTKLSKKITTGFMFISDYGYEAVDLYASWRKSGTLMAFREHNVQQNVLDLPGIVDLTAHVNFTALSRAADSSWTSDELVSQAEVLVSLGAYGLLDSQSGWAQRRPDRFLVARKAIETLTDPNGLGRIRVRVMRRGVPVGKLLCQSQVVL